MRKMSKVSSSSYQITYTSCTLVCISGLYCNRDICIVQYKNMCQPQRKRLRREDFERDVLGCRNVFVMVPGGHTIRVWDNEWFKHCALLRTSIPKIRCSDPTKQEKIEDKMAESLAISAQVSIQFIMDSDIETMDLFFLLGMLPGGVSPKDLDELWHKVTSASKSPKAYKLEKAESFKGSAIT